LNVRSLIRTTWTFCLREASRLEDRRRVVAHQLFDLGVADDRQPANRLGGAGWLEMTRAAATPNASRAMLASRGAPC